MTLTEKKILRLLKNEDPKNPMSYLRNISGEYSLEKVRQSLLEADLDSVTLPKSIPKGSANADLMIISDSVSLAQSSLGKDVVMPMEGTKGGDMLEKVLDHFGVNPDEIFYMNVVNGLPYKEVDGTKLYRTPSSAEVNFYKVYLKYVIDIVRPSQIILLGSIALNVFHKEPISQARGTIVDVMGIPAMPTYHPEYFVQIEGRKSQEAIDILKDDFVDDIESALLSLQRRFPNNNVLQEKIEEQGGYM